MKLIPDSSFFICFFGDLEGLLDDAVRIEYFIRFLNSFTVEVTPIVYEEITEKNDITLFESKLSLLQIDSAIERSSSILQYLKPIFAKGEFEVICMSFYYNTNGISDFFGVLDDGKARELVIEYISEIRGCIIGTIGLIRFCNYHFHIFTSVEAINILEQIKKSNFRISPKIVDNEILKLKKVENGTN